MDADAAPAPGGRGHDALSPIFPAPPLGAFALDSSRNGSEPSSDGSPRSERAILTDFLGTLGGPDHSILVLYMEGLPYQEIADVTGLSVSAVGVRIHRMKLAFTDRYVER